VVRQWKNLKKYVEARIAEAFAEFELAEEFLEGGLHRARLGGRFNGGGRRWRRPRR